MESVRFERKIRAQQIAADAIACVSDGHNSSFFDTFNAR